MKKSVKGLSSGFICSFVLSEAREAFIKQFSSLEASTGRLLAQLHGITSPLNCSLSMTEEERNESRKDEGSRTVCQTFTEMIFMIRGSQKELHQATLDLDNMVGHNVSCSIALVPQMLWIGGS